MNMRDYLTLLATNDGSDLYLTTGAPPAAKFHGTLKPIEKERLKPGVVKELAYALMDEGQQREFEQELELNLAISEPGVGRFRVNVFKQRNQVSMVIRNIKTDLPHFADLGLPEILTEVIMTKRGLVLFVGGTGSGKSTSLAALIDHRNSTSSGHIITIEDPIEFVHKHKKSIVNQREVGMDTRSFAMALKNTLRQAPDVILIGEIRDQETMEHALAFAETGHLAISTLHANNANQALDRIINFFPEERRPQLLQDLSSNLRAFVSQRLVKTVDGKRAAAIEILIGTSTVQELIKRGEVEKLKDVMAKSGNAGMQDFDTALLNLWKSGKVSLEEALKNADAPNNLKLKIKLSGEEGTGPADGGMNLSLQKTEEEIAAEKKAAEEEAEAAAMDDLASASDGGMNLSLESSEADVAAEKAASSAQAAPQEEN